MARYRKISVKMWGDKKFLALTKPQPCGQWLWVYLLSGPHTTAFPGAFVAGEAALAEALNWSVTAFRKVFTEVLVKGLIKADAKARIIFIPKAINHNPPESPNVVKAWRSAFDELPDCALKVEIYRSTLASLIALGFSEAYQKAFGEAFTLDMTESDSESDSESGTDSDSEQEQNRKGEEQGDSPATEKRAGRRDAAADLFADSYRTHVGNPYGWLAGDFPQMAKLRKRLKLESDGTPLRWESALTNYFATAFGEYTLQHFAAKFDTFMNSPLDRYKVPTTHVNGGNGNGNVKSKDDINRENAQRLRARLDSQDRERDERDAERSDSGGVPGAATGTPSGTSH